jgi:hypothetical protein
VNRGSSFIQVAYQLTNCVLIMFSFLRQRYYISVYYFLSNWYAPKWNLLTERFILLIFKLQFIFCKGIFMRNISLCGTPGFRATSFGKHPCRERNNFQHE